MKNEIRLFLTAILFYTRIPCPAWVGHGSAQLNESRKYFPLIGWIIGGIAAAAYESSRLVFPASISLVLSMAAGIVATGAFHEDGFADTCDGFGGGWTKEQILLIMKDSRLGTYGAVGIALLLSLKFLTLLELEKIIAPGAATSDAATPGVATSAIWRVLLAGHVVSRFMASLTLETHDYVRQTDDARAKPMASSRLGWKGLIPGAIAMVLSLLLLPDYWLWLAVAGAFVVKLYMAWYFKKWIGGYTGDCLGAIQQVSECVFYLCLYAIWSCL